MNSRPLEPHSSALPGCATPRLCIPTGQTRFRKESAPYHTRLQTVNAFPSRCRGPTQVKPPCSRRGDAVDGVTIRAWPRPMQSPCTHAAHRTVRPTTRISPLCLKNRRAEERSESFKGIRGRGAVNRLVADVLVFGITRPLARATISIAFAIRAAHPSSARPISVPTHPDRLRAW